jgi:hypothetical protein
MSLHSSPTYFNRESRTNGVSLTVSLRACPEKGGWLPLSPINTTHLAINAYDGGNGTERYG